MSTTDIHDELSSYDERDSLTTTVVRGTSDSLDDALTYYVKLSTKLREVGYRDPATLLENAICRYSAMRIQTHHPDLPCIIPIFFRCDTFSIALDSGYLDKHIRVDLNYDQLPNLAQQLRDHTTPSRLFKAALI